MIKDSIELHSRRTAAPRQMPAHYDSHAALQSGLKRAVRKSPGHVSRKEMAMIFEPWSGGASHHGNGKDNSISQFVAPPFGLPASFSLQLPTAFREIL